MAHDGKGGSGWVWAVIILVVVVMAFYFSKTLPSESAGSTQTPGTQNTAPTNTTGQQTFVDPMMVGTWRSVDDVKFTREFRADGTVADRYAGDDAATAIGTWIVVDPTLEPSAALGVPAENLAGMTVLKLTFSDGTILYFGVNSLSETSLTLTYLGRGNILRFTRVQ